MFLICGTFSRSQKGMIMFLPKTCCSFCIDGHFIYQWAAQCHTRHTGKKGSFRFGHKVRSECSFRASCYSTHLSRAQVPAFAGSSVQNRKKKRGGGGGTACTGGYKRVQAVRPTSIAVGRFGHK